MIVSCLKPPGPLPLPLSPTVAKVFWFNLPLVTKFCVCVLSVPVWNLKVGIFSFQFYPTQFTPPINLFKPLLLHLPFQ